MTDDRHFGERINRNEPTLGDSRRVEEGHSSDGPPPGARRKTDSESPTSDQLKHERRDERQYVRVGAPFQVQFGDGHALPGHDLSLGGFSIHSDRAIESGSVISVSLLLMAGAAELIVPVTARALRNQPERKGDSQQIAFEITGIDQRHRELLRRVIRSHLSGRYAAVENLIEQEDPQTPRKRHSTAAGQAMTPKRRKPWGRYAALIVATLTLVVVGSATAYRNFMLIEPSFAAVTAPRIDIRAPGPGILTEHGLQASDKVERDEKLAGVKNSELETDLILARASHTYNGRLIENMQKRLDSPEAEQISTASSATPADGEPANFETVSPVIAQSRIEQFTAARDYESSRIDALEARMSTNDIYSPCNCLVAWALSSAGGTYINESERIMTLIKTGQNDVMVEALVHMSDIGNIEPHQQAYIALPNASEPIAAKVRTVALDVERQPRAGFPKWVRQQQNVASVLLVPEEPLPASAVGVPVDVRFSEAPMLDETAEWIWQGGRAVAQQTARFFNAAASAFGEAS